MYVETTITEAITAFGFKNWKINVSINLTGFLFLLSSFSDPENEILYAK